ncbi:MAG: lipocalin family protein [Prevotella sp.]|nr:lipocalin family protein [Prevotella sp.]
MKKYLSLIAFVMMAVVSLSLTACGDDDDDVNVGSTSELVGTWDIVNTTYYSTGESPEVESGDGEYWVFTADKLTVHYSEDLANGESFDYTYDSSSKEIYIDGDLPFHVTALSKSSLTLRYNLAFGSYIIIKLKKRSK